MRELGWGRRGERSSVKEEGRGGGSELDLDLDPDPWKILWIRIWIRQNDADLLDPDPQHCYRPTPLKSFVAKCAGGATHN